MRKIVFHIIYLTPYPLSLEWKKAATYHLSGGKRRAQLKEMGVNVQDTDISIDGNIITSTSPATEIEVALKLVEQLTDVENANHIRYELGCF